MALTAGTLPPVGSEFSISFSAVEVPLQIHVWGLITLDFKGSRKMRVEKTIDGGVMMKLVSFEASADSPILGRVTLCLPEFGFGPLSLFNPSSSLELLQSNPVRFRETLTFSPKLTIEKPIPGGPSRTLVSTKPLTNLCVLNSWPPAADVYHLLAPSDFVDSANYSQVVVTLNEFPATYSHNP